MQSNWPRVVWLLGWPLVSSITDYIGFAMGLRFSEDVRAGTAVIDLLIWAGVAILLRPRTLYP